MKINWGTGLVIGLAVFIIFILNFVIRIAIQDKYDHELVTENYYEKELLLQKEIDGAQNANSLSAHIKGEKTAEGYMVYFPEDLNPKKIKGKLIMYRPSDKSLDFQTDLNMDSNQFLVPDKYLAHGRWDITIDWEYDGKQYFYKERIRY